MKILDSSVVIAILDHSSLIDKILQLGHRLTIPSNTMMELISEPMNSTIQCLVRDNKIHILNENSLHEIKIFQKKFPRLGIGECDVILSYEKLSNDKNRIYCILDDLSARKKESK